MYMYVAKKFLLYTPVSGLLSNGLGEGDDPQCIIDVDMFHYLVAVTMALPSLYTEGTTASNLPLNSLNNQYILELVLTAHIVQVMLLHDRSQDGEEGEGWVLLYDRSQDGEDGEGWVLGVLPSAHFLPTSSSEYSLSPYKSLYVVKTTLIFNKRRIKFFLVELFEYERHGLYFFLILWLFPYLLENLNFRWYGDGERCRLCSPDVYVHRN